VRKADDLAGLAVSAPRRRPRAWRRGSDSDIAAVERVACRWTASSPAPRVGARAQQLADRVGVGLVGGDDLAIWNSWLCLELDLLVVEARMVLVHRFSTIRSTSMSRECARGPRQAAAGQGMLWTPACWLPPPAASDDDSSSTWWTAPTRCRGARPRDQPCTASRLTPGQMSVVRVAQPYRRLGGWVSTPDGSR